eukprot:TRINITY_DN9425_c0_g1_i1.p1 TRINITY_DN9425_c0_g1~~TRINITY_DN9425_c0_g1_i1.p1  ORF type:complete len:2387 (+),score=668.56 TRINITY_DN9425_c0_g1_i1:60-7220(+)
MPGLPGRGAAGVSPRLADEEAPFGHVLVKVLRAVDLPNKDSAKGGWLGRKKEDRSKSDAYIVYSLPGISKEPKSKRTKDKLSQPQRDVNPDWGESDGGVQQFKLNAQLEGNPGATLEVVAWDKDKISDDFIGSGSLPLQTLSIQHTTTAWVELTTKQGTREGKVEVQVTYSPPPGREPEAAQPDPRKKEGAEEADETPLAPAELPQLPDDDPGASPVQSPRNAGLTAPRLPGAEEQLAGRGAEKRVGQYGSGEWQIRVEIIQGRGLMAQYSDREAAMRPYVKVGVGGAKGGIKHRATRVSDGGATPWFDEELVFTVRNPTRSWWNRRIELDVFNRGRIPRISSHRIGGFSFEIASVYSQKKHEYYRRWVALTIGDGDFRVRGYLQVSVMVVGPRDDIPEHDDEEAEDEDDMKNVLQPKRTTLQQVILRASVFRAEGIPRMDHVGLVDGLRLRKRAKEKADPFVRVMFGGSTADTATRMLTYRPEWNQFVRVPMSIPSFSEFIKVQLIDYDALKRNDVIATRLVEMSQLTQNGVRLPTAAHTFLHFYGSPREYSLTPDIGRIRRNEMMNLGESEGSHYRGRVLISFDSEPVAEGTNAADKQHSRESLVHIPPQLTPRFHVYSYALSCHLLFGTMLPRDRLKVELSVGEYFCQSSVRKAAPQQWAPSFEHEKKPRDNQYTEWFEELTIKSRWEASVVRDSRGNVVIHDELPQIALTLMTESGDSLAYTHIDPADLQRRCEAPVQVTFRDEAPELWGSDRRTTLPNMLGPYIMLRSSLEGGLDLYAGRSPSEMREARPMQIATSEPVSMMPPPGFAHGRRLRDFTAGMRVEHRFSGMGTVAAATAARGAVVRFDSGLQHAYTETQLATGDLQPRPQAPPSHEPFEDEDGFVFVARPSPPASPSAASGTRAPLQASPVDGDQRRLHTPSPQAPGNFRIQRLTYFVADRKLRCHFGVRKGDLDRSYVTPTFTLPHHWETTAGVLSLSDLMAAMSRLCARSGVDFVGKSSEAENKTVTSWQSHAWDAAGLRVGVPVTEFLTACDPLERRGVAAVRGLLCMRMEFRRCEEECWCDRTGRFEGPTDDNNAWEAEYQEWRKRGPDVSDWKKKGAFPPDRDDPENLEPSMWKGGRGPWIPTMWTSKSTLGRGPSTELLLRAYIYKAHDLPAGDSNGLADPFVRVIFGGQVAETNFAERTLNPTFNESLELRVTLPDPSEFPLPPVVLEVWDHDVVTRDELLGRTTYTIVAPQGGSRTAPQLDLLDIQTPPGGGQLLCCFELFDAHTRPELELRVEERPRAGRVRQDMLAALQRPLVAPRVAMRPIPAAILPRTTPAVLDIFVLGVRQMLPYMKIDITKPSVEFEIEDCCVGTVELGSSSNHNFLERIVLDEHGHRVWSQGRAEPAVADGNAKRLLLPKVLKYFPALAIKVYDERFFGQKVLVASATVPVEMLVQGAIRITSSLDPTLSGLYYPTGKREHQRPVWTMVGGRRLKLLWNREGGGAWVLVENVAAKGHQKLVVDRAQSAAKCPIGVRGWQHRLVIDAANETEATKTRQVSPARGTATLPDSAEASLSGSAHQQTWREHTLRTEDALGIRDETGSLVAPEGTVSVSRRDSPPGSPGWRARRGTIEMVRRRTTPGMARCNQLRREHQGRAFAEQRSQFRYEQAGWTDAGRRASVAAGFFDGSSDGGSSDTTSDTEEHVEPAEREDLGRFEHGLDGEELDDNELLHPWLREYFDGKRRRDGDCAIRFFGQPLEATKFRRPGQATEGRAGFDDTFHTFTLYRGKNAAWRPVGSLKANIMVFPQGLQHDDEQHTQIGKTIGRNAGITADPVKVLVRVYVVCCKRLRRMDSALEGGLADPYLEIQLGPGGKAKASQRIVSKDQSKGQVKFQTLNPEFMQSYELKATLPHDAELKVSVWDWDRVGFDDLVGHTTINLEDRFFSQRFRNDFLWNREENYGTLTTWPYACHLETRPLTNPAKHGSAPMGVIRMWVDVLHDEGKVGPAQRPSGEAYDDLPAPTAGQVTPASYPSMIDLTLPPNEEYELRVIVWNCRNVPLQDTSILGESMSDIYVKSFLAGGRPRSGLLRGRSGFAKVQQTDVHYRSKDGVGMFNWRFKFPVSYVRRSNRLIVDPESDKARLFHVRKTQKPVPPVLTVQIWDSDLLPGTDDYLGEVHIPLDRTLQSATIDGHIRPLGLFRRIKDKKTGETRVVGEVMTPKIWFACYAQHQNKDKKEEKKKKKKRCCRRCCSCFFDCCYKCFNDCLGDEDEEKARLKKQQKEAVQKKQPPRETEAMHEEGLRYRGEVQLSFQLVPKSKLEHESFKAGFGRDEPNTNPVLQEPVRPDDSFLWWQHPLKSLKYIVYEKWKVYLCAFICIVLTLILFAGIVFFSFYLFSTKAI